MCPARPKCWERLSRVSRAVIPTTWRQSGLSSSRAGPGGSWYSDIGGVPLLNLYKACGRKIISWCAWSRHGLPGEPVRGMLIEAVETGFSTTVEARSGELQFLSDNSVAYRAHEAHAFAVILSLHLSMRLCAAQTRPHGEKLRLMKEKLFLLLRSCSKINSNDVMLNNIVYTFLATCLLFRVVIQGLQRASRRAYREMNIVISIVLSYSR